MISRLTAEFLIDPLQAPIFITDPQAANALIFDIYFDLDRNIWCRFDDAHEIKRAVTAYS